MKVTVYALYNNYLSVYDLPQFRQMSTEDIAEGLRRSILMDPDAALKNHVDEKSLVILGTWEDEKCKFDLHDEPKKVCDLAGCFPRGYLAAHKPQEA